MTRIKEDYNIAIFTEIRVGRKKPVSLKLDMASLPEKSRFESLFL